MPENRSHRQMIPLRPSEPKGRILVIDDEADIRESLETLLTLEGYAVELAAQRHRGPQRNSNLPLTTWSCST